jgi:hypothetical protein
MVSTTILTFRAGVLRGVKHNAPPLHLCVERVSCPEAKFAANRTWKNDLTFG